MADDTNTPEPKAASGDDADLLKTAAKRWDAAYQRDKDNIDRAYADLRLVAGDDEEHWGPGVKAKRETEARPCFTVNRLPQYIKQVTGDQRQMRPSMRVVPVDGRATKDTADLIGGMLRYIEHRSAASAVYNRAGESQVACGVGAWRVVTEYAADSTFEQEIGIADVDDPVLVLWDSDATKLSRADAMFCHVPVDLSRDAFETRYPGKTPTSFSGTNTYGFSQEWASDDYVRVTEYWFKKPTKKVLGLLPDGGVDDLTDDPDAEQKASDIEAAGGRVERRDAFCVYRAVISCDQVLEPPTKWPGRYIPIIPVIGNEIRIGRRVVREGAVRHARDPQRIYNYSTSAQVEVTALQPKAPFIGTETHFESHQAQWEGANTENRPYLTYTPDPLAPQAKPERVQPPVASQGIQAILVQAGGDIEGTIGIYKSSIGAESNEKSGKAILAREKQADTSTYVYIQNLSEAIAHTARVVLDLIPHVYDTEREVRAIGLDGTEKLVKINRAAGLAVDGEVTDRLHDVTIGAYDVVLESGPSYATKREEAREGMLAFIQGMPNVAPLVADLIAKSMDWPNADAFAERLKHALPPQIAQAEQEDGQEPNPAQIHAQIEQHAMQAQQQVEAAQAQIADAQEQAQAKIALEKQAVDLAKRELALIQREIEAKAAALQEDAAHQAKVSEHQQVEAQANGPAVAGIADMLGQMQAINAGLVQTLNQIAQAQQQDGEALRVLLHAATAPKRIVRDPVTGLVAGTEPAIN